MFLSLSFLFSCHFTCLCFNLIFGSAALQAEAGCAEVDSMTEAVAGESFMLGCISCKKREEVVASTSVDWFFRPIGEESFVQVSVDNGISLETSRRTFFSFNEQRCCCC